MSNVTKTNQDFGIPQFCAIFNNLNVWTKTNGWIDKDLNHLPQDSSSQVRHGEFAQGLLDGVDRVHTQLLVSVLRRTHPCNKHRATGDGAAAIELNGTVFNQVNRLAKDLDPH